MRASPSLARGYDGVRAPITPHPQDRNADVQAVIAFRLATAVPLSVYLALRSAWAGWSPPPRSSCVIRFSLMQLATPTRCAAGSFRGQLPVFIRVPTISRSKAHDRSPVRHHADPRRSGRAWNMRRPVWIKLFPSLRNIERWNEVVTLIILRHPMPAAICKRRWRPSESSAGPRPAFVSQPIAEPHAALPPCPLHNPDALVRC